MGPPPSSGFKEVEVTFCSSILVDNVTDELIEVNEDNVAGQHVHTELKTKGGDAI